MAPQQQFTVPEDFLAKPAKNIVVNRIDFARTTLPSYKDRYAVVLDNVLTLDECNALITAAEASAPQGWERAMINVGGGMQALYTDQRNCGRIIWDEQTLVDKIWARIAHLPDIQEIARLENRPLITGTRRAAKKGGKDQQRPPRVWKFSRPNERMRFLKYVGGEYFRPHCDGVYETPDGAERSWFTLHLYLNGTEPLSDAQRAAMSEADRARHPELVGGATLFHSGYSFDARPGEDVGVDPKVGRILIFQHRDLLHSGDDVVKGVKYTLRTDLMYALE